MKVSNVFLSIMLGSSLVIAGCGGSPTNNNGDGQKKESSVVPHQKPKSKIKSKLTKPTKNSQKKNNQSCDNNNGNVDAEAVLNSTLEKFDAGDAIGAATDLMKLYNKTESLPVDTKVYIVTMCEAIEMQIFDDVANEYGFDPYDENADIPQEAQDKMQSAWQLDYLEAQIHLASKDDKEYMQMIAECEQEWEWGENELVDWLNQKAEYLQDQMNSCPNNNGGNNDSYDDENDSYGSASVVECTDNTFNSKVINTSNWQIKCKTPFIIDFNATWCGPCQQLRPILEKIQKQYGNKIQIFSVDVEKCSNTSEAFGVENLPTLLFFNPQISSDPVKQTQGFLNQSQLQNIISSQMKVK